MQITHSATRDQFPLSTKKILKKTLASSVSFFILLFIVWIFLFYVLHSLQNQFMWTTTSLTAAFLALLVIVVLVNYLYQRWYFAVYFYDLTPDFIQIRKGPITPREITLPYERIQDVYVDQDLLDRILGLYDVHISSATASSGMSAHIDGVEKDAAQGLRGLLLSTVKERISKNPQPTQSPPTNNAS